MKRMTALLLSVIMMIGMLPVSAVAAGNAPQNVHWQTGNMAYLAGAWDPPTGTSHNGYDYDVAIYYSANGTDNWKSLGYHYLTVYTPVNGVMTVDPSYTAMYGVGYYKFAVACSSLSTGGASEWVESEVFHFDGTGTRGTIAAPLSGSFDAETQMLSWTDPENMGSGIYDHIAVLEMWFTGAEGELPESQWTRVGYEATRGSSREMRYLCSGNLQTGVYAFTAANLAEDYLWRGMSEKVLLDGYYTHVEEEEEPATGAEPDSLYWTESGGVSWEHPGADVSGDFILELLWCADESDDPAEEGISLFTNQFGIFDAESWPYVLIELSYMANEEATAAKEEMGLDGGVLYFRVKYLTEDGESAWAYSNAREMGGTSGTPDTPDVPVNPGEKQTLNVYKPVWTQEALGMDWDVEAEDLPMINSYAVQFYYCADAATLPDNGQRIGQRVFMPNRQNTWIMPEELLCGDGYYYFRVCAYSKDQTLADNSRWSEFSGPLQYKTPDLRLNITSVDWDGQYLVWDGVFDKNLVDYYEVHYYYGETEDTIDYENFINYQSYDPQQLPVKLPNYLLRNHGVGYYTYDVRAYSNNPLAALSGDWSAQSQPYHHESTAFEAPTDLQWHVQRYFEEEETVPVMGAISFAGAVPEEAGEVEYLVDVYRKGAGGDTLVDTIRAWLGQDQDYATVLPFELFPEKMTSSTYYFTVKAVGDGVSYDDSDIVTSAEWTYTRPDTVLQVGKPYWNTDMTIGWTDNSNGIEVERYRIRYQFVGEGDVFDENTWDGTTTWYPWSGDQPMLPAHILSQYGDGTFYVRICAISADITEAVSSDWSEWSEGYVYDAPDITLSAANLRWTTDGKLQFDLAQGNASMVDCYQVRFYYGQNANAYDYRIGGTEIYDPNEGAFTMPLWAMEEGGPGYYWFSVRVYSNDLSQALDSNGYSELVSTPYYYQGPDQQAPQATELQWHVERYDAYNSTAKLGVINFKNPCYDDGNTRTEFKITVFEQLANGNRVVGTLNTRSRNLYVNAYPFDYFPEEMTTGTYYFAVTTVGDKITTSNSEPVVSGTWDYTRPAAQKTISAPVWNDNLSMNWTDGTNPGDFYQLRIQWVGEGGTFYEDNWQTSMTIYDKAEATLPEWLFTDYGPGTFYFQVRAMSEDITKAVSSDWTEWSVPFKYTEPNKGLITISPDWADGMQMTWTTPSNLLPYVKNYEVYFYHSDSPDAEFDQDAWWDWERYMPGQTSYAVPEWLTGNLGEGYYWFRVVALTSDPTQAMGGLWSAMSPAYYLGADGSTLAPTDLQWDTKTGVLSFKNPYYDGDTDTEFRVEVFRKDAAGNVENVGNSNSGTDREYIDWALFENRPNDLLTGDYYFTVYTKMGNGHGQSEKVTSPVWSYTRPEVQLEVSNPVWTEDMKMNWTNGTVLGERYKIRYQFVPAGGTFDAYDYNGSLITDESGNVPVLEKWLEKNGAGTYYFCVMALSDDLTEVVHSTWTDWSAGYEYTGETQQPELPKLSAPTEVHWHKEATWGVTGDSQMVEILIDRTGSVAWTRAKNADGTFADHGEYELEIYDAVTGQCVDNGGIGIGRNSTDTYVDSPNFIYRDLPSGTYYFRVRAVSLDDQHAASDWVTSETWTYTQPNAILDTPANLRWNVSTDGNGDPVYVAEWDEVENRGFFDVRFYYAADENSARTYIGSSRDTRGNSVELPAGKLEKYGDGLYFFTVRAIPEEIEDYQRGNESEISSALNTREPVKPAISAPAWKNSTTMTWDSDLENVDHYQIQIQYVPAGGTFHPDNWQYSMHWYDGAPAYLEDEFFYNYGSGTYYFRVNACVNQDGSYVYTDYSDWSAGMSYTLPAPNVTAEAYGRYLYVDGFLPEMADTQYHIAVYSGEGQMLDMLTLDGLSEQAEIDLDSDCPNGAYVRVFTTEGWTPVGAPLETTVTIMR